MRRVSTLLALLLLAACKGGETATDTGSAAAPAGDIILVTIDTWRADAAGFAGNKNIRTPFLDSLAARGVVFTNAHAHNVITLPSHANILTGLNPYQHGVHENAGFVLDAKHATVAETLRANGWATGAFISAFPLDARFGLNRGFEVYDDNYGKGRASVDFSVLERRGSATLEAASRWWASSAGKKRFLWVHLYDPHAPYAPPEPFATEYQTNRYLGEVASVDEALAKQLAPMIGPETTVIVTSDHGEALGDHGELTHGLFAYESTLKVPLLVAGPGIRPRSEPAAVRHIDIAPTILASAGIAEANDLPGQSLLGPIQPAETYFESLSASLNRGWAPLTGVIREGAKYIDLPLPELYDLASDPQEEKNLVDERRRDVVAARKILEGMRVEAKPNRNVAPEELAQLRSLGYVGGDAPAEGDVTAADDPKNLVHLDAKMHRVVEAFQRHQLAEAVRLAREVVGERPGMAAGQELLAFVLQESEKVSEAIDVLGRLAASGKAGDSAKLQLALLLSESGKAAQAATILAPIVSRAPNADNLNAYGIALADEGKPREAVEQFRRALELDPNNAPAFQNLGIVALKLNDVASAQQYLNRALELNPRLPLAWNTLGVVRARQNDLPAAVDAWKRAVSIDAKQYDALFNIGLVQARAGQKADARAALEQFARTAPRQRYASEIAAARQALTALR